MFKILISTIVTAGSHDGGGCAVSSVVVEFETAHAAKKAELAVDDNRQISSNAIQIATALF